jgi:DNA-directed RNA polymerase subunit alpha
LNTIPDNIIGGSHLTEAVLPQIECSELSEKYGRFVIEPLERGYGVTLGNALRRVLLNSITGSAVTWMMIEGIQHEFSTISNVKEDTVDFILNVKSIRLRALSSHGGKLTLRCKGERQVTAGDIEPSADFEIVNPDMHLATLDTADAKLEVEFNVEQGKGYRLASKAEGLPIGAIPIDAIFTPIRRVNYKIETVAVEELHGYERLTVDIWTDGTVSPVEAVSQSAHMLIEHFQLFYELAKVPLRVGEKQPRLPIPLEQYNMPIEELDLSVRTFNCLKRAGITKVGELFEKSEEDLLSIKNFGQKALEELKGQLQGKGFNPPNLFNSEVAENELSEDTQGEDE